MIRKPIENPIVAVSVSVYKTLLVTYPARFQREYGPHMVQVFRDCCLQTIRRSGTNAMLKLWAITLFDLIQSLISEHGQKEIQMKTEMKPEDIRLAGNALMWGAAAFVIGIFTLAVGDSPLWGVSVLFSHFLGMPLSIVGLLAIRNRYGEKAGGFGKNILLVGSILGPLVTFAGLFGASFGNQSLGGILFTTGPAVLFACLALFGLVALYKRPLPRWNWVPLIAGLGTPVIITIYVITALRTGVWDGTPFPQWFGSMVIVSIIIQGVALATLGDLLKSDAPDQTPAVA